MVQSAVEQTHASEHSEDSRASALHTIAAVGNTASAAESLASGSPDVKIELSFGSSQSKQTMTQDTTTHGGSSVKAGGTAAFSATGGDLTIAGSNVDATDVVLTAKDRVNLVNRTDTDSSCSTNESSSLSVGVSYGTQGYGVDASGAKAHGHSNSDSDMQNNTHIDASNSVTLISGGDTNMIGANVNAREVNADVGGNLNIASVQDTSHSDAHQESVSGGVSISQAGGGGSFSSQNANAHGDYAGVNEQSGIHAGDGGFKINVAGNTDLKGAVIASDADASKNVLNTGTLTFSDIENHSDYDAKSSGFSAGGSMGAPASGTGPSSQGNSGGFTPMLSQNDSGSSDATTKSAISAGTINIADKDHQTQDVASLNRDTTDTNGQVSTLPDVNHLLDKQGDLMNAASATGQAVATQIGTIANAKRDAANKAADQAMKDGNPELAAQYKAEAASWDEGGTNRVAMHTAGGALIAGLGGGSALSGAAGAGAASALAGKLNQLADTLGNGGGTDPGLTAGNVLANLAAGGIGGLVGGESGAFAASNADLYNRSSTNGEGKGGKGSEFVDFVGEQLASAGRGAANLAEMVNHGLNEFFASGSGQQPPADANPLTDVTNNSKPPAAGGSVVLVPVCAPPVCTVAPVATPGTPGYVPSNAIYNSGDGSNRESEPVVIDNARTGHLFRESEGHLADTPGNRTLLETVANDPNAVAGKDKYGTVWSSSVQADGTQVWVGVRNGKVSYGGVNQVPKEFNSQTGFSSPTRPGATK
jgi:filamentous hemagglutinin